MQNDELLFGDNLLYMSNLFAVWALVKWVLKAVGWLRLVKASCNCYQNTDLRNQG